MHSVFPLVQTAINAPDAPVDAPPASPTDAPVGSKRPRIYTARFAIPRGTYCLMRGRGERGNRHREKKNDIVLMVLGYNQNTVTCIKQRVCQFGFIFS